MYDQGIAVKTKKFSQKTYRSLNVSDENDLESGNSLRNALHTRVNWISGLLPIVVIYVVLLGGLTAAVAWGHWTKYRDHHRQHLEDVPNSHDIIDGLRNGTLAH